MSIIFNRPNIFFSDVYLSLTTIHFFQYLQYMLPYEDLHDHIAKEASELKNKDKNRDIDIVPRKY